ncbi:MAG: sulfotransferase [Phycisphaerales bacterium]|nr:sulfotransferase [Phycisphaerales bacterium]
MRDVDKQLQKVDALMRDGHTNEAHALCEQIVASAPDHAGARHRLGVILEHQGQLYEAITALREAVALDGRSGKIRISLGKALLAAREHDEAIDQFKIGCRLDPRKPEPFFQLAVACEAIEDLQGAVENYQAAINQGRNWPAPRLNLARTLSKLRRPDEAIRSLKPLLDRDPNQPDALAELARAHLTAGRTDEAMSLAKKAATTNPRNPRAHLIVGNALLARGMIGEAIATLQAVAAAAPNWQEAQTAVATALKSTGRMDEAEPYYEKAAQLSPIAPSVLCDLGFMKLNVRKFDESHEAFDLALVRRPDDANAIAGKAVVLDFLSELDEAYDLLTPVVDAHPSNSNVLVALGTVGRKLKRFSETAPILERAIASGSLPRSAERRVCLTLANLYDAAGEYDKAWHSASHGNKRQPCPPRARRAFRDRFRQLIDLFTSDFLDQAPRATETSQTTIIVCGMPRSGTSLVEQILASHPHVHGCGELPDLPRIAQRSAQMIGSGTPYPLCLAQASGEHLTQLGRTYLDVLEGHSATAARITDKLPHNFLHLGFLSLIQPNCRIIHCTRHPLDTCISCFFHDFLGTHAYTSDLSALGEYYRLYRGLMRHWRDVLDIRMLDVSYETLVDEQEKTSREMIAFCGLEWDDACLRFHKSKRIVNSLSYDQVRQPIYRKSIRRFDNYQPHLGPLVSALGDELGAQP